MEEVKDKEEVKPEQKPVAETKVKSNIKFVHKTRIAPTAIHTNNVKIELPEHDVQSKGFYHEDAKLIISTFPDYYKAIK